MNKWRICGLVLLMAGLAPGIALATHFSEVSVTGDCEGWTAVVSVTWRTGIYDADFDYAIRLMDGETPVEEYLWSGILSRGLEDPADMVYTYSGDWSGEYAGLVFNLVGSFHLISAWDGGVDEVTAAATSEFTCTVASETTTWSAIKAIYQ